MLCALTNLVTLGSFLLFLCEKHQCCNPSAAKYSLNENTEESNIDCVTVSQRQNRTTIFEMVVFSFLFIFRCFQIRFIFLEV